MFPSEHTWTLLALIVLVPTAQGETDAEACQSCRVLLNGQAPSPEPLILRYENPCGDWSIKAYLEPDVLSMLHLDPPKCMRLVCPGPGNYFIALCPGRCDINISCIAGQRFQVDDKPYCFNSLACSYEPRPAITKSTRECPGYSRAMDVGYRLGRDFLNVLEVCFDFCTLSPLYVHNILVSSIMGNETPLPRPARPTDMYHNISLSRLYEPERQKQRFAEILGSMELAETMVTDCNRLDHARLAPTADFVFHSQQSASYSFLNGVPVWRSIRLGNWQSFERSVRKYASTMDKDLEIYTGTLKVLTMQDKNDITKDIFLLEDKGQELVPVPLFLWKIVYDRTNCAGVAVLTVNDPYMTCATEDLLLCTDISECIPWILWERTDFFKGFSYCCEVDEFIKKTKVLSIAKVPVDKLLPA